MKNTFFQNLKKIIEQNDSSKGRFFDLFIQSLIILSVISFSIETIPDLDDRVRSFLAVFELIAVIIFSIEYILRIIVSDKKLGFIFSFYGIIDLIAILPFFLASGIDLRSLRAVRMLRIIRSLKLIRYSKALKRFHAALISAKEELVLFILIASIFLFFAAAGIYYFENPAQPEVYSSIFESLWWAIVSFTTVGYGDIYPITVGGKIFTSFILFIGMGVIAVPTGIFASALSKVKNKENHNISDKEQ